MAEDTPRDEDELNEDEDFGALTGGDSGLGNLPPLSDFDSAEDDADGNLPPLGKLDTDSDGAFATPSDMPSPGDMRMETPQPRSTPASRASGGTPATPPTPADPGGLVTPEFSDAPAFDTPTSDLDTPEPAEGFGFQDLAADSDFSPETPEIGPGPDSDIETPMFDSAFGGDTGEFGSSDPPLGSQKSAPTQAMETPMFDASPSPQGDSGGGFGFDNDAFGGAPQTPTPIGGNADIGTPIPDFSPDTGVPNQPTTGMTPQAAGGGGGSRGLTGVLLTIFVPIAALVLGILAGPFIADNVEMLPNPAKTKISERDDKIAVQENTIRRLSEIPTKPGEQVSQDQLEILMGQYQQTQADLNEANAELGRVLDEVQDAENTLTLIKNDIDERNEEYVQAEELLEELQNNTEITRARHQGLLAENERLTDAVGQLEDANVRRQATKDALLHSLDELIVALRQSIPLAPARYSQEDRVARAEQLRSEVLSAKWVNPEIMNTYSELQLAEREIASSREYFFAKVPVHDQLGTLSYKWAECLMNGNWSVYYRTIDGQHVGSYENVSSTSIPDFQFREDLPQPVQAEIGELITASRVDDYESKFAVLREKERVYETETGLQRNYSSL